MGLGKKDCFCFKNQFPISSPLGKTFTNPSLLSVYFLLNNLQALYFIPLQFSLLQDEDLSISTLSFLVWNSFKNVVSLAGLLICLSERGEVAELCVRCGHWVMQPHNYPGSTQHHFSALSYMYRSGLASPTSNSHFSFNTELHLPFDPLSLVISRSHYISSQPLYYHK